MTVESILRARVLQVADDVTSEAIAARLGLPVSRVEALRRRPLTYPLRSCEGCGELFAPIVRAQRYCCPEHRYERRNERACEFCGETFTPVFDEHPMSIGAVTVDDDFPKLPEEGIIAWQLHAGGAMEAVFRNIQFTDLNAPVVLGTRPIEAPPAVMEEPGRRPLFPRLRRIFRR